MKRLRQLAVVVSVLGFWAAGPPSAHAATPAVGVGALATVSAVGYVPPVGNGYPGEPLSIGDVRLQDGIFNGTDGSGRAVDDVHIGPLHGTVYDLCAMSRNCGVRGWVGSIGTTPAPLTGTAVGGERITGACAGHNDIFDVQFGINNTSLAIQLSCTASVGPRHYDFTLDVDADVALGATFVGPYCAGIGCVAPVVVENPGLVGP